METKPTNSVSTIQNQLKGIIIILVILVLNAVMTFVILSNRTTTLSETDRIRLKNEIISAVEDILEEETPDLSSTCLEGDEDCLDTVNNPSQSCLAGDEDCLDESNNGAAGGTCLAGDEDCIDNPGLKQ